ncbi:MAG: molybdenum cofactor guanylyltransferase [Gemmatimonadaceae bacterium]|nr:molybdenum cofactor guanylyltransferase [Gemmatimonadaceae bacterium]
MGHRHDVDRCIGVIMAGGGSTRFGGRPKGLERVGRARLIDRVADALRTCCDDLLLVANDPEAERWIPGVTVRRDVRPNEGGLGGLHAALTHAAAPVIVVAWDMPFVTGALLQRLRTCDPTADAVLPWSPGPRGVEPLCAWYAPACLPVITRCLDAGERAMVGFHHLVRLTVLPEGEVRTFGDPSELFLNVNTTDDLARAQAIASR